MFVTNIEELHRAPRADVYLARTSLGTITLYSFRDAEELLRSLSGPIHIQLLRDLDPVAIALSPQVFEMGNNAAALLQSMGYKWDPRSSSWTN